MRDNISDDFKRSFIISIGWLFADMLLALAMLFLAVNTVVLPKPPLPPTPSSTPPPSPTKATASGRVLESEYCRMVFNNQDPDTFADNFAFAKSVLEPQINRVSFLKGRVVGIAIAWGGVDDFTSSTYVNRGLRMAHQVYNILRDLGKQHNIFKTASYFDNLMTANYDLFNSSPPSMHVVVDIYFVVRPQHSSNTCSSDTHKPI